MTNVPEDKSWSVTDTVAAARRHWAPLAAFAWEQYLALGRGGVVVAQAELHIEDAETTLQPGYVPVDYVPKGDDFRPLMQRYDPEREVLLVVCDPDGQDTLLRLQCEDETNPAPPRCWANLNECDAPDE